MDTRLKKTHKLTIIIITLVVLLPALLLTSLYPRFEQAAEEKRAKYEILEKEMEGAVEDRYVTAQFPSYIVEAVYCMYGEYLQQKGQEVDYSVLEEYGWTDDYSEVVNNTEYYVSFGDEKEIGNSGPELEELLSDTQSSMTMKEKLEERNLVAALMINFDTQGRISKVRVYTVDGTVYGGNARSQVLLSQEQYENNVDAYEYDDDYQTEIDEEQLVPKNVKAIFALSEESSFVGDYYGDDGMFYDTNSVQLYLEIGALAVILVLAAFVALSALLLPFVKKLETGWERPFNHSFEAVLVLTVIGICGAMFMYELMCVTSIYELDKVMPTHVVKFLGFTFTLQQIYQALRVLGFFGWALLFWMEYVVVSSIRQFLCGPVDYMKHRLLGVRFIRWCIKKGKNFWNYVTDGTLGEDMNKKLLLLVAANGLLVFLMCVGFVFGGIASVAYSIVIYVLLRQKMEQIQKSYGEVTETVHEMAEGNLNIAVPSDLGIFQDLGYELSKVKDGFAKAVAEEAKSQNMKTELITNVSHDLKTPLTAIITYVDLLKNSNATEEEKQSYIEILGKKSQRLKVLIEDLFEVSKAQSGTVKLNQMNVDVVNLMKQVRTELEDKIADSNVTFRWNLPEEKVLLYLDGQKTYRVFENLLNNMIKYGMPYTRAYIDIVETAYDVQICFRNVSAAELDFDVEHLTDRFVRGDASRNSEGSGLGLAIAKSFVELQGGQFQIEVDGDLFKVILKWNK